MNKEHRVKVKFYSKKNGGREKLPIDLLSSGKYRPHLVIGDPNQRNVIHNEMKIGKEEYLGITFVNQKTELKEEQEIEATISTLYSDIDYNSLTTGATFTIREGGKIVGNGKILK